MWLQAHLKRELLGTAQPRICGARSLGDAQMAARETKKQHTEEKAVYEMTAAERTAIERHFARREAKPSVRLKVSRNGSDLQIAPILRDLESSRRLCFKSGKIFFYCGKFRRRHLMGCLLFSVLLLRLSCCHLRVSKRPRAANRAKSCLSLNGLEATSNPGLEG